MSGTSRPPDPLGKRALYWVSLEEPDPPPPSPARRRPRRPGRPAGTAADTSGKRALYSRPRTPSAAGAVGPAPGWRSGPSPGGSGPVGRGRVAVTCSACGDRTAVGLLELATLHLPVWAFVPLRRYDHWMRCPACGRRTWVGVSLAR